MLRAGGASEAIFGRRWPSISPNPIGRGVRPDRSRLSVENFLASAAPRCWRSKFRSIPIGIRLDSDFSLDPVEF